MSSHDVYLHDEVTMGLYGFSSNGAWNDQRREAIPNCLRKVFHSISKFLHGLLKRCLVRGIRRQRRYCRPRGMFCRRIYGRIDGDRTRLPKISILASMRFIKKFFQREA
jgi:hypothetical protein